MCLTRPRAQVLTASGYGGLVRETSPGGVRKDPRVLIAMVAAQAVIGTLTVRDINRRADDEVRGPKLLWRLWGGSNMFGAAVYWIVGRRRPA